MTIDKAIEKLKARYDTAKDDPNNMVDPVEWSTLLHMERGRNGAT